MNRLPFKAPSVITTLAANVVMVLGALIGWFTLSATLQTDDSLVGNILQNNLNDKKTTTIVAGVIALIVTVIVVKWSRVKWLEILAVLLDAFIVVTTFNQLSDLKDASSSGLHYGIGYWLSLVASVVATVGCIWLIVNLVRARNNSVAEPASYPQAATIPAQPNLGSQPVVQAAPQMPVTPGQPSVVVSPDQAPQQPTPGSDQPRV